MASANKSSGPSLVPPPNFAMVEEGVYRSAYPAEANVPYLRHIGITHIVLLSVEQLPGPVRRLLSTEVTGTAASGCLTRGPIRVVEIVEMRTWRVDGANSGDDFSRRDVTRALDFAVDRRWHPVLFACPLGELHTNVVVGCMRRYQHWALSSIFSECELYTTLCRTLRQSILLFIESWDPALYPISAVNVQYRHREMAMRERSRAHKERRKHRHNGGAPGTRSGAHPLDSAAEDSDSEETADDGETGGGERTLGTTSDLFDGSSVDGRHSSTVSSPRRTRGEASRASTPPSADAKTSHPDAAFISTSGQRPPMMVRRAAAAAAAARLREQQQQQQNQVAPPGSSSSVVDGEVTALAVQLEESREYGVPWAEWYLEAIRVEEELRAQASGTSPWTSASSNHGERSFATAGQLPPPHELFARARNPPAVDARSTFTKESIVEEDDD